MTSCVARRRKKKRKKQAMDGSWEVILWRRLMKRMKLRMNRLFVRKQDVVIGWIVLEWIVSSQIVEVLPVVLELACETL